MFIRNNAKMILLKILLLLIVLLKLTSSMKLRKNENNTIVCYEENCKTCTNSKFGSCIECKDNFKLVAGSCICYDPNCLKCTSSLMGACKKCKNNFILYNGICYCLIKDCDVCGETQCNKCLTGYELSDDKKSCILSNSSLTKCYDEHCTNCKNQRKGTCEICEYGYYAYKGECVQNEECNRTVYDNGTLGKCESCPSGFKLSFLITNPNELSCSIACSGQNCTSNKLLNTCEDQCLVCIGYTLYEYLNCISDTCEDPHCILCRMKDSCNRCDFGYELINGECVENEILLNANETHCLSTDNAPDSSNCSLCMNNYDLNNNGECIFNQTSADIYQQNINPIILEEIKKQKLLEEERFIENGSEEKEEEEYSLEKEEEDKNTSNDDDISQKSLIKVDPDNNYQCTDPNCIQCDGKTTNNCIKCNDNYTLKDGSCKVQCNISYCKECSTQNICKECESTYELKDNKCINECGEHCINCVNNKICFECETGWSLNENLCIKKCKDNYCSICMNDPNKCDECNEGYISINDKCESCFDDNCAKCNSQIEGGCLTCKTGTLLIKGKCANKCAIENCDYCLNNICVKCKSSCKLKDGSCKCTSILLIILICLLSVIVITFTILCIFGLRKKNRNNEIRMMERNIRNYPSSHEDFRLNPQSNQRFNTDENIKQIEDEFENNKLNSKNDFAMCDFCLSKIAKYISDCGCNLCKEHAKNIKDNEDENQNKKCPKCGKIINTLQPIKKMCGICLENKLKVACFNCKCALLVCKQCYIKVKLTSERCPACRGPI